VKFCRVLPRLRVAAWAGVHRRTHPVFSGQALSAGYWVVQGHVACQSLLGCADRIIGMQRHRLIFDGLLLLFHEYITPPAAVAVRADLDTRVLEEDPVSSAQIIRFGEPPPRQVFLTWKVVQPLRAGHVLVTKIPFLHGGH
jgi:hypothetical protein